MFHITQKKNDIYYNIVPTYPAYQKTMKTTATQTKTHQVPTTREVTQKAEEIDTYGLTEVDLDMLKKEDPFLYHSIPSVRKDAGFLVKNADQDSSASVKNLHQATAKVTRKSRISVECYDRMTIR